MFSCPNRTSVNAGTELAIRPVETPSRPPGGARWAVWLALGLMLVLASALRLWKIHDVTGNVFYDAAVRSMGDCRRSGCLVKSKA